ncbi:hypothetical protein O181_130577 [Austropuccinia psidii MF-1]|uniref:Uncharacterized protein n=1 Tax=Austropuccinia psidii MF-1 TaxID=1389203 RepID=A0A9Q3L1F5_9BASI|nr:hypothetical protein [Austropuccinia psidii MF-1]
MSETDEADNTLWIYWPNSETNEESQYLWINHNFQVLNNKYQRWGLPIIEYFKIPIIQTIPFIEFEDSFLNEDITQETLAESSLSQLPGSNLSKLEFMDILNLMELKEISTMTIGMIFSIWIQI